MKVEIEQILEHLDGTSEGKLLAKKLHAVNFFNLSVKLNRFIETGRCLIDGTAYSPDDVATPEVIREDRIAALKEKSAIAARKVEEAVAEPVDGGVGAEEEDAGGVDEE